jgi:hypothetical protein
MPWIHVVAATLLVLGTVALLAFLRSVESLAAAECERGAADMPAGTPVRWPPPPAVAAKRQPAPLESTPYRHAA